MVGLVPILRGRSSVRVHRAGPEQPVKQVGKQKKSIIYNIICWTFHLQIKNNHIWFFVITDINECLASPCVHGNCSNTLGSYFCSCDAGWTGTNCNEGEHPQYTPTLILTKGSIGTLICWKKIHVKNLIHNEKEIFSFVAFVMVTFVWLVLIFTHFDMKYVKKKMYNNSC